VYHRKSLQIMRHPLLSILALTTLTTSGARGDAAWIPPVAPTALAAAPVALIPFPKETSWTGTRLDLAAGFAPEFAGVSAETLQIPLADLGSLAPRGRIPVSISISKGVTPRPEGYSLTIGPEGVTIVGADHAGVFYAVKTLLLLAKREGASVSLPCCAVRDWPAFAVRGFMHDTGRNFRTVAELKAQIDLAASFKVNLFHWHLTDGPAWRVQSRVHPKLNDAKFRKAGRDEDKSYSFDELREVIAYAKARHVSILPELDMPGHSEYFKKAFGVTMDSMDGMLILEKLIAEFCAEIPKADCPRLHLGSDEVHIKDPKGFMKRMGDAVRAQGRTPVIWNPGLPNDGSMIEQVWADEGGNKPRSSNNAGVIDSSLGYANGYEPLHLVRRYYFGQPCRAPEGDNRALGSILCVWPDVRVDDKRNIERHNAVWPGMLAMVEAAWVGRPSRDTGAMSVSPPTDSAQGRAFAEFEHRLAALRDTRFSNKPFPFIVSSGIPWRIAGPYPTDNDAYPEADAAFESGPVARAQGGSVMLADADGGMGIFAKQKTIGVVYAETFLFSETARIIRVAIGFESAARSNRRSGGLPQQSRWDNFGSDVSVNGVSVAPPVWKQPGRFRYLNPTWFQPSNEIPFTDEEFWWTREPATVSLKAGKNRVLVKAPCGYKGQNWSFTFVPVTKDQNNRYIEDTSVRFATRPE
jgi:hexosaminidase